MRYLGGKAKIAKHVARVVDEHRLRPDQLVWEPFCGGLNVTSALWKRGVEVYASDVSEPLIALYHAVQQGWDPPASCSEDEWRAWRELPPTDPRHGFARFGLSFGGDPNSGYAGSSDYTHPDGHLVRCRPASACRKSLLRDVPRAAGIACIDFLAEPPDALDFTIYCDPPYRGRRGYGMPFDHDAFVGVVAGYASRGSRVLVSEYEFPLGRVVWERERNALMRGREKTHVERIYLVE